MKNLNASVTALIVMKYNFFQIGLRIFAAVLALFSYFLTALIFSFELLTVFFHFDQILNLLQHVDGTFSKTFSTFRSLK